MINKRIDKRIHVLTRDDSQKWHSPFSSVLRDLRQESIIDRCRMATRDDGAREFTIYDADECTLYRGDVAD